MRENDPASNAFRNVQKPSPWATRSSEATGEGDGWWEADNEFSEADRK